MRKKLCCAIVSSMILVMCIGCASNSKDTQSEKQNEVSTQVDTLSTENGTEVFDGIEYNKLSRDTLVVDTAIIQRVLNLVVAENELIREIESDYEIDSNQTYEVDGRTYDLVKDVENWAYYENIAKDYYSDTYLAEQFTGVYIDELELYVEVNGKLYRAWADGIVDPLIEDTIEVWQVEDDRFYVTIQTDSDQESSRNGYIIRASEDKVYGFEIIDKVIVY